MLFIISWTTNTLLNSFSITFTTLLLKLIVCLLVVTTTILVIFTFIWSALALPQSSRVQYMILVRTKQTHTHKPKTSPLYQYLHTHISTYWRALLLSSFLLTLHNTRIGKSHKFYKLFTGFILKTNIIFVWRLIYATTCLVEEFIQPSGCCTSK